jgi:hypothetical protein
MFSVVAFSESQDNAGVYANVGAVIDRYHKVDGDFLYIREFNNLIGGMACMGATAPGQVYLTSPSLRQMNHYWLNPVEYDISPGAKVHIQMRPLAAYPLTPEEALEVLSNANPAAAEQHSVAVWLSDGAIQPVKGKIITINATITLAQTAGTWAYSELTLANELPVGVYKVVGARFEIAGGVIARFIPKRGLSNPGAPCVSNGEEDGEDLFRNGNLGEWLSFDTNQLPGVEVLGSAAAASATYQVYLDILV